MFAFRRLAPAALGLLAGSAPPPAQLRPPALTFTLGHPARHLAANVVVIPYELANTGRAATYVSQLPGPALDLSCSTPEGGGEFINERGAWSTDEGPARSYFVRLAPGETLYGERALFVPPRCTGSLYVRGEFDADTVNAWGLAATGIRFQTTTTLVIAPAAPPLIGQAPESIALVDRLATASKIYQQVEAFFPELSEKPFERDYREYLDQVVHASDDRMEFDLASMALVATLHDSHSWFYDSWLDQAHGQGIGLTVYRYAGAWVVIRSRLGAVKVGDVIEAIDSTPTEAFFQAHQRYISASSERDAAVSLFDAPVLFPERFIVILDGGRRVAIDRPRDPMRPDRSPVEARWLVPGKVGYVRLSAFTGVETSALAWRALNEFENGSSVILDLRGNIGGGDPRPLQQALMGAAYPMWRESSTLEAGAILRGYGVAHPGVMHMTLDRSEMRPRGPAFTKPLVLLVDRGCTCACEDFAMPFKISGRARLVGETTAGSFSFTQATQFANGMRLNMSAVRHSFPDGSRFEGVGITPDVEVVPSLGDLKAGRDPVLLRALELARGR